jgi:hypothetical protein
VVKNREEHIFALAEAVDLHGTDRPVNDCATRSVSTGVASRAPASNAAAQCLELPAREALHRILGVELALELVGECGTILRHGRVQTL